MSDSNYDQRPVYMLGIMAAIIFIIVGGLVGAERTYTVREIMASCLENHSPAECKAFVMEPVDE